jgi:hypothetical protein
MFHCDDSVATAGAYQITIDQLFINAIWPANIFSVNYLYRMYINRPGNTAWIGARVNIAANRLIAIINAAFFGKILDKDLSKGLKEATNV